MISKTLLLLTNHLNSYLKLYFRLNEDIAYLCSLKESGNNILPANRVSISLVNVEREWGGGIAFSRQDVSSKFSSQTAPSWQINVFILFSAIFQDKQYEESLQIFSGVLTFIQKNNRYSIPDTGEVFAIEPVNLSFQEQSNLWSICGGNYYPSILCKIRVLNVDEQEIQDLSVKISQPESNTKITS